MTVLHQPLLEFPALRRIQFLRQLRNEDYFLKRELPPTAKPYREEFHDLKVQAAE